MQVFKSFPRLNKLFVPLALIVGVASAVALPAGLALAGEGAAKFAQMADAIGLSADQREKASEILQDYQMAQIDSKAKVEKARLELRHIVDAEVVDEKAAYKALDVLMAAENESARNRLKLMLDLRKIMTLDQWQEAEALREQGRHHHGGPEDGPDDDHGGPDDDHGM